MTPSDQTWPEQRWERRTPTPELPESLLREMLERAIGPASGATFTRLSGGLVNDNHRVDGRDLVLRVYARGAAVCEKEAALLRRVAGAVPVPEIVFVQTDGPGGHAFCVQTLLPGERMVERLHRASQAASGAALGRSAGATLARLHAFTEPAPGFFGPGLEVSEPWSGIRGVWTRYLTRLLADPLVVTRLDGALRARLERVITRGTTRLDEGSYSLLHADYKPTNLLVCGDRVSGVLDWEFSWAGPPLFDLGQLLRWAHQAPPDFAGGVAAGYTAHRPLPSGWRTQARLLDLMNLVGFLEHPGKRPSLEADVRELITRTLDALERT